MRISFHGATETVTGSRHLVETDTARVLVDCGLFQGLKRLRLRNWDPPTFPVRRLDAVVLTHAHIDHSGYLPRMTRHGYRGPIHCTPGTAALLRILLPDAAWLQEEDARHANKYGYSKHHPAEPLYTRADAEVALGLIHEVPFDRDFDVGDLRFRFTPAGHIVGAACVRMTGPSGTVGFTGDVGRPVDPLLRPPRRLDAVDWLVTESTYGDRRHPTTDPAEQLAEVVREVCGRGGVLLIPAFAVGRAQTLLLLLHRGMAAGTMPRVPVYLDSPMAVAATRVFEQHTDQHRISAEECKAMVRGVTLVSEPEESKRLSARSGPMVVISASGMCTGGRVLHHLKAFVGDRKNGVLLVGYQAAGTRGQSLLAGADELKIHGAYWPVEATVRSIDSLSAHADQQELLDWLRPMRPPRRTFVVHGEPAASDTFRRLLSDRLGWEAIVPAERVPYEL